MIEVKPALGGPTPASQCMLVCALKDQGLDPYWVDFTPAPDGEDSWTLKYRLRLSEWSKFDEVLNDSTLRFSFDPGVSQILGTKGLITWVNVYCDPGSDFTDKAWLIAHPSLRLLLTAPDAEWFE